MADRDKCEGQARTAGPFQLRRGDAAEKAAKDSAHLIRRGVVCGTEERGYPTPGGVDPRRIVVEAPDGFVVLWAKDSILRFRHQPRALAAFADPAAVVAAVDDLLAEAILRWGDAAPVTFRKAARFESWDFEIVVRTQDDCDDFGCVLASAFFPDAGRHQLVLYPQMFEQTQEEQVETMLHELGHVFGLRHFFAQVSETAFPSEIFGTHSKFSIMNYGADSRLTRADRDDLKRLYWAAWSGELTNINGTPIRFVHPYSTLRERGEGGRTTALPFPRRSAAWAAATTENGDGHRGEYRAPAAPPRSAHAPEAAELPPLCAFPKRAGA